ncbi:MAG: cysteine desulfurase [Magnetococcus sp. WYHC-3]
MIKKSKQVFVDFASTTPTDEKVLKAMMPFFRHDFSNPSSLHGGGVIAKKAIEIARKNVAKIMHCRSEEIIFTGSGTESDNLAIIGVARAALVSKRFDAPKILTLAIEHLAITRACEVLEKEGIKTEYIPVDENGKVKMAEFEKMLDENVVLVSVMHSNNEIGTLEPVHDISRKINAFKAEVGRNVDDYPYFHVDACQSPNYFDVSKDKLGADLITLDGSKVYGPKGVGLLFKKRRVPLEPIIVGSHQEGGFRAGTENVAGIVGLVKALEISDRTRAKESERALKLQKYFWAGLEKIKKETGREIKLNGHPIERLPNNVNICIPGLNTEFTLFQLDAKGICVSAAATCKSLERRLKSYVLEAVGSPECAESSLRFTFGRTTTRAEVDYCLKVLGKILKSK